MSSPSMLPSPLCFSCSGLLSVLQSHFVPPESLHAGWSYHQNACSLPSCHSDLNIVITTSERPFQTKIAIQSKTANIVTTCSNFLCCSYLPFSYSCFCLAVYLSHQAPCNRCFCLLYSLFYPPPICNSKSENVDPMGGTYQSLRR